MTKPLGSQMLEWLFLSLAVGAIGFYLIMNLAVLQASILAPLMRILGR